MLNDSFLHTNTRGRFLVLSQNLVNTRTRLSMFRSLQYCKTNYCYIIDSLSEYINILFYAFDSNNPIVSVCNNCDRLFVPKTKKLTLYCDMTTNEHTTCKQIGAKNKFQIINHIAKAKILPMKNDTEVKARPNRRVYSLSINRFTANLNPISNA